jgi:hypothetical protein
MAKSVHGDGRVNEIAKSVVRQMKGMRSEVKNLDETTTVSLRHQAALLVADLDRRLQGINNQKLSGIKSGLKLRKK